MFPSTVVGSFVGTGAAKNIAIGFPPDWLKLTNRASGRTVEWYRASGDTKGIVSGPGVTTALLTTTGPTALTITSGLAAGFEGFATGTDTVNNSGDTIDFVAVRNGPGEVSTF